MPSEPAVIWITGASSGIGAELAEQLATPNTRLILTARTRTTLEAVADRCRAKGAEVKVLPADLLVPTDRQETVSNALAAFGTIDTVIHSAGVSQRGMAATTNVEVDRRLMELDYFAPMELTKALLPVFAERKKGMVVVIGSIAGLLGFPLRSGYCAAKHALQGFFQALQVEHTMPGIHVVIVHPGRIRTHISERALTAKGIAHGEMDPGQASGMPVHECAQRIIRAMHRKEHQVSIGYKEELLHRIAFFFPAWYRKLARSQGGK